MTKEQKTKTIQRREDFLETYSFQDTFEKFLRNIKESNISMHELSYWYWELIQQSKSLKKANLNVEKKVSEMQESIRALRMDLRANCYTSQITKKY
jgi:hypothetical protein